MHTNTTENEHGIWFIYSLAAIHLVNVCVCLCSFGFVLRSFQFGTAVVVVVMCCFFATLSNNTANEPGEVFVGCFRMQPME